ncbi:MAG: hypothetical protein NT075_17395 [Chloroflexi bacterium]|nr:hypothetical protein [Chloroflexota bacterium]
MRHQQPQALTMASDNTQSAYDQSANFSAPRCSLSNGRLVFASGAIGVTLYGDPLLPDLYQAHFTGHLPNVSVQTGIVTIQYNQLPVYARSINNEEAPATIALNGTIAWEIECRGGLAHGIADLRELALRSLDLGSVSGAALALPQPAETIFIYMAGSVSDVVIYRPRGVAARVQINGSASHLRFDEQDFGAVIDGVRWQSVDYNKVSARYEISIAGSASNVRMATW